MCGEWQSAETSSMLLISRCLGGYDRYESPSMCALRGPQRMLPRASFHRSDPPPTPTVLRSSERVWRTCPPSVAARLRTRPARTRLMSVEVPPTSRKIPSLIFEIWIAALAPAAGPESTQLSGRSSIIPASITPPSLFITTSFLPGRTRSTASRVKRAVETIFGIIAAFITAVFARSLSPKRAESSLALTTLLVSRSPSSPSLPARSDSSSPVGSSVPSDSTSAMTGVSLISRLNSFIHT